MITGGCQCRVITRKKNSLPSFGASAMVCIIVRFVSFPSLVHEKQICHLNLRPDVFLRFSKYSHCLSFTSRTVKLSGLSHLSNISNDPHYGLRSQFFCDNRFQAPECWKGAIPPRSSHRRLVLFVLRGHVVSGCLSVPPPLSSQRHSLQQPHRSGCEQRELQQTPRHGRGVSRAAVVVGDAVESGRVATALFARGACRSGEAMERRTVSGSKCMATSSGTSRRRTSCRVKIFGVVESQSSRRCRRS